MRKARHRLTRIRRKNSAFNYGFFRPDPLAFEREAGKNAGHGSDFARRNVKAQGEILSGYARVAQIKAN